MHGLAAGLRGTWEAGGANVCTADCEILHTYRRRLGRELGRVYLPPHPIGDLGESR